MYKVSAGVAPVLLKYASIGSADGFGLTVSVTQMYIVLYNVNFVCNSAKIVLFIK